MSSTAAPAPRELADRHLQRREPRSARRPDEVRRVGRRDRQQPALAGHPRLEEVQDNNGPTNDGIVDADVTLDQLIATRSSQRAAHLQCRQIDPVDHQDGGEPGGNIRAGVPLPHRPRRRLRRSSGRRPRRPPTTVVGGPAGPSSLSPGRIDPTNPAFNNSRKPLVGEFMYNGHSSSWSGTTSTRRAGTSRCSGRASRRSLSQRGPAQPAGAIVSDFVARSCDRRRRARRRPRRPQRLRFSKPLNPRRLHGVDDLIETLPRPSGTPTSSTATPRRSTTCWSARSGDARPVRLVHVNAEFTDQVSDHDPQVARFGSRSRRALFFLTQPSWTRTASRRLSP